ncbi:hypothetical protein [uncultured Jannaschia sp.]|uniref:hypothetical protein n=1 Tax=uncultured Jannaschia sp. TaxID=293347 RepID=UPI00260F3BCA|nr:hypothetical protein [uncultured Jannaschia sp.]
MSKVFPEWFTLSLLKRRARYTIIAIVGPSFINAAEVTFEITPLSNLNSEIVSSLKPALVPMGLIGDLDPEGFFDRVNGKWIVPIQPLDHYLTELSIRIEGAGPHAYPPSPIALALPYRDQKPLELIIHFLDMPVSERVSRAYGDAALSQTPGDLLSDFLFATKQLTQLTNDEIPSIEEVTPVLTRTLVVYGEALGRLVDETDWFGIPSNSEIILEMMRVALDKTRVDARFADRINVGRLVAAKGRAESAEYLVYRRVYSAIESLNDDLGCNEIFPIALPFYHDLAGMSPDDYRKVREQARITKSHVLAETTRCFRMLLTKNSSGLVGALPQVVEGKFGGLSAREMRNSLDVSLRNERRALLRETGLSGELIPSCVPEELSSRADVPINLLCDALAYLEALKPLIEGTEDVGG